VANERLRPGNKPWPAFVGHLIVYGHVPVLSTLVHNDTITYVIIHKVENNNNICELILVKENGPPRQQDIVGLSMDITIDDHAGSGVGRWQTLKIGDL
jgi:hypothetical protein